LKPFDITVTLIGPIGIEIIIPINRPIKRATII
jgi:hypothetical protein